MLQSRDQGGLVPDQTQKQLDLCRSLFNMELPDRDIYFPLLDHAERDWWLLEWETDTVVG